MLTPLRLKIKGATSMPRMRKAVRAWVSKPGKLGSQTGSDGCQSSEEQQCPGVDGVGQPPGPILPALGQVGGEGRDEG